MTVSHKTFEESGKHSESSPRLVWLESFDANCNIIVDYLVERGAGRTLYSNTLHCFKDLRDFLLKREIAYSEATALQWLKRIDPIHSGYRMALYRLIDLYEYGSIQPVHEYSKTLPWYSLLNENWKREESEYLSSLDGKVKSRTWLRTKNCIACFLYKMQDRGILYPTDLTFDSLEDFINENFNNIHKAEARDACAIKNFLTFLANKGACSKAYSWYVLFKLNGKLLYMQNLSEQQLLKVESHRNGSENIPCGVYEELIPGFLKCYAAVEYCKSRRYVARYTVFNLLVFLKMHDLNYHPEIAMVWLEHEDGTHEMIQCKRRVLKLFDLYTKTGEIPSNVILRNNTSYLCENLPLWCCKEVDSFLALKMKEGWQPSTLQMYRYSVTRFCVFIASQGISSFAYITPALIKKFNVKDKHRTAAGKNAYNVRIRAFLRYLARRNIISYGIDEALVCVSAPRTQIVRVLNEDEKAEIIYKFQNATTPMELRDRAMVLIGLRLGLRPIDIVQLKLTDINWEQQTIRFIQQKTKREIELPMPTDVGNAIYLYLKHGRISSDLPFVFLKMNRPYDSLSTPACRAALHRILADLDTPVPGFKTLRKTFATNRLQSNVRPSTIADMLGHKGLTAIDPYLNLDTERMSLCPLSLEEAGLTIAEEIRYE